MKKQKRRDSIVEWDSWEIDGTLTDVIAKLQKLIDDRPGYFDFKIMASTSSGYYGDASTEISISADRWETDKEFQDRITADKSDKETKRLKAIRDAEANEKRERSLYESLKRKFDKEIKESQ